MGDEGQVDHIPHVLLFEAQRPGPGSGDVPLHARLLSHAFAVASAHSPPSKEAG